MMNVGENVVEDDARSFRALDDQHALFLANTLKRSQCHRRIAKHIRRGVRRHSLFDGRLGARRAEDLGVGKTPPPRDDVQAMADAGHDQKGDLAHFLDTLQRRLADRHWAPDCDLSGLQPNGGHAPGEIAERNPDLARHRQEVVVQLLRRSMRADQPLRIEFRQSDAPAVRRINRSLRFWFSRLRLGASAEPSG